MKFYLKRAADAAFGALGYKLIRTSAKLRANENAVHFLHIGKNVGTQIQALTKIINEAGIGTKFIHHSHDTFLRHIPENADFFFSVRDPISRFKSGFYSRKRKGQPRIYSEWTQFERRAFEDFEHANDLAESLFAEGDLGRKAFCAIKSISHTAMNQVDWFYGFGNLFDLRPPVSIVRQEHFEKDFEILKRQLGIDLATPITRDPVLAHKNDYSDTPALSEKANANLRIWYSQDFEFYQQCEAWLERRNPGT